MTVKSRICAIRIMEHISKNPRYAEKVGIEAKMRLKDAQKCGQREGGILIIKNRTKNHKHNS